MEAVQLMKMMDDMLAKAGVDQQKEELTELSQVRQKDKQKDSAASCLDTVADTVAVLRSCTERNAYWYNL